MHQPPHALVRNFELIILVPLQLLFVIYSIAMAIGKQWLGFVGFLIAAFFIAVVGQGLPHRKEQSSGEMAQGNNPGKRFDEIRRDEATGLGVAMIKTALIISVLGVAVALHRGDRWYSVILTSVIPIFAFPVISIVICGLWSFVEGRAQQRKI